MVVILEEETSWGSLQLIMSFMHVIKNLFSVLVYERIFVSRNISFSLLIGRYFLFTQNLYNGQISKLIIIRKSDFDSTSVP